MEQTYDNIKQGERGAWLSIAAYLVLSAIKIAVGLVTGSEALLADGYNNSTDIVASLAVLIGLRISRKPPDENHRYGHYRAETVAALLASFIMFAVGLKVLMDSVQKIGKPSLESPDLISAWTALFSAAAIYGVYLYNIRLARRINSHALTAAAQDNRSDAMVSIGAFLGIIGSQFGLPWLDPLTAFIVGAMICKTAWDIFGDATHALTDGFNVEELQVLRQTIYETPGVENILDLKGRIHGNQRLVDVTIGVDHQLNVSESHEITERIEQRMAEKHDITHVHIHIEPFKPKKPTR